MRWKAGKFGCKIFTFFNYATMSIHAFMLIFQLVFLYFWYRKQESYMTQEGTTVVRQTKMHKWAIPLAWVIGKKHALKNMTSLLSILAAFEEVLDQILPYSGAISQFLCYKN